MIKEIPYIESLPSDWNVIPNRYLFYYGGKKVGDEHAQYQLLSLTTAGVKKRDINATGGKVPTSYDNYQTVKKGQMVFCLFDLDCSAVFSGISEYDGMITSAYDVFSTSDKMDTRYADYWFKYVFSNRYYKMYSKNIRYTITGDMFRALKTPVPPLEVQKQISSLLHNQEQKIDNLIANVQAQIEKLKAYKQSLITEVVTKGLDPNAPMKDSELPWFGLIPRHWKLAKIKMYATTCSGGTPPSGDISYYNGKINWVCSYDLCEKEIEETEKTLSDKGAEHIAGTLQLPNSILVAMYGGAGTIGNSGLLKCYARTNQAICSIHFDEAVVEPKFAFYQTMFIRRYWMFFAVGTRKDPNISQDIVRNMKYVIPPIQEQTAIATYLDAKCSLIDQLISLKESKIEKLQQYKRSLIYEYVTGKKEVV